jgi:hypothetical protein
LLSFLVVVVGGGGEIFVIVVSTLCLRFSCFLLCLRKKSLFPLLFYLVPLFNFFSIRLLDFYFGILRSSLIKKRCLSTCYGAVDGNVVEDDVGDAVGGAVGMLGRAVLGLSSVMSITSGDDVCDGDGGDVGLLGRAVLVPSSVLSR